MKDRTLIVAIALSISLVTIFIVLIIAISSNRESGRSLTAQQPSEQTKRVAEGGVVDDLRGSLTNLDANDSAGRSSRDDAVKTAALSAMMSTQPLSTAGEEKTRSALSPLTTRIQPLSPQEISSYILVTDRLTNFFLTTEEGEFINVSDEGPALLHSLNRMPRSSYHYDAFTKLLLTRGQDGNYTKRVRLSSQSDKVLIYRKRLGRTVIITDEMNRPLVARDSLTPLIVSVQRQV